MSYRTEETTKVRRALKAAGYTARVRHGTGTASHWIEVTITGTWTERDFNDNHHGPAYMIVKRVSGREHLHDDIVTDLSLENILLDYKPVLPTAEQYAAMTFEELDQRASDLRRHLHILEQYHMHIGEPHFDFLTTDLNMTSAALAKLPNPYEVPA